MDIISKIKDLQHEINIKNQFLLPQRELASHLREKLRRREEAFAYTGRQEPMPVYEIVESGSNVKFNIPVDVLLKYVDKDIEDTLKPLEEQITKLNRIKELLGENYE